MLTKFKTGDKVTSDDFGAGEIICITSEGLYPINVKHENYGVVKYTKDGQYFSAEKMESKDIRKLSPLELAML